MRRTRQNPLATARDVVTSIGATVAAPVVRPVQALVCFTFDDAFSEDFSVVKPILDTRGVKGGFPMQTNAPGNAGYMSWAQVKQLHDEGHEIIAHTTDHGHVIDSSGLTEAQKRAKVDTRSVFESHGIPAPRGFAYTFGENDANLRRIVRDYYEYALATTTGSGSQSPLSTYCIRRIALKDSTVTADHYAQIDAAITNGEILVFIIHSGSGPAEFTSGGGGYQRLADVLDYAIAHDVPVVTPAEAFDACRNVLDTGDFPGGSAYGVIDGRGKLYTPDDSRIMGHASDALTKLPSAFALGTTFQLYQSSSGAPGSGPGTVYTVIVDTSGTVGGLNYQIFQRNGNNGLFIRAAATDNGSWMSWKQLDLTRQLSDSTSAIGTLPSAYSAGVTLQNVTSPASPATPSGGPGVLRTVITVPGSSGVTSGQLNYQEFVATSNNGKWIRNALSDNTAWLSTWKRVEVDGGLAPVVHAATAKTTPVSNDEFFVVDSEASNAGKRIKYSDLLAAISAAVSAGTDPDALTSGESTLSRRAIVTAGATLTSGLVRLTYFTAKKTETINSVRVGTGTTAAGTPTLCRIGIYSVDGSGDLTLVASTANDTALWAAGSTTYTKALSAAWSKVAGQRYAVGLLFVGTTAPTIQGQVLSIGDELGQAPRLCGGRSGQTDLPSSITVGNVSDTTHQCYVAMVP